MNSENNKSKFGLVLFLLALVVLVALGGLVVFLWSVSPTAVLILIGLCFVVGVPALIGILLMVVIAGCASEHFTPHRYFDWSTAPRGNDRFKER